MPCSKKECIEVDQLYDTEELCNQVMNGELFGFLQVDIHVPDKIIDKFSKFCPLFVMDSIPAELIPSHMREYQTRTRRKTIRGTTKLFGVTRTEEILLYSPMLKWYISHGMKVTAIRKYLRYKPGQPFSWFSKEVRQDVMETAIPL